MLLWGDCGRPGLSAPVTLANNSASIGVESPVIAAARPLKALRCARHGGLSPTEVPKRASLIVHISAEGPIG